MVAAMSGDSSPRQTRKVASHTAASPPRYATARAAAHAVAAIEALSRGPGATKRHTTTTTTAA